MLLTVVGCSGSVSGPRSPASCYLVQAADAADDVLAGARPRTGSARRAATTTCEPADIGAVGLSHLHPDHCLDLCGLYVAAAYSPARPVRAHPGLRAAGHRPPGSPGPTRRRRPQPAGVTAEEPRAWRSASTSIDWAPEQIVGPFTVRRPRFGTPRRRTPSGSPRRPPARRSSTPATPGPNPALVDLARRRRPAARSRRPSATDPDNPPDLHLSGRQAAADRHGGAGRNRRAAPTFRPGTTRRTSLAEARPHFAGPLVPGRVRGAVERSRPATFGR